MFASWKTTFSGIAAIVAGVAAIVNTGDLYTGGLGIVTGIGLILGKDWNVSSSKK